MNAVATILTLVALSLVACSSGGDVTEAIGSKVRGQNLKEIRLVEATSFEWEKVYFFGPYMPRSKVCETLGVHVKYCERVVPFESQDDGVMSMAFVSGTRVVRYERHKRWNGDFLPVPEHQPISASKAVFRVVPDGVSADGSSWLRLVQK